MITNTYEEIALIIKSKGLCFETFKTFQDLLRTAVVKRVSELWSCGIRNPLIASVRIKEEVKHMLDEFIAAEKDKPKGKDVCSISKTKSCHECSKSQIEKCGTNGRT